MDIVYPDKYFSKVKEKFPELSEKQIKEILYYGTRMMFMMSYYGVDLKFQQRKFFVYIGEVMQSGDAYSKYRKARLSARLRVLHNRKKIPYSGKYYFTITKETYDKMPKKKKCEKIPLDYVIGFKIPEESMLQGGSYLYEVDMPVEKGYKRTILTNEISHYKLIAIKDNNGNFIPVSTEEKQKTVKRSQKKGDK